MRIVSFIFSFLMIQPAWGLELSPNALILTHTSRHYQTGQETIEATQKLIQDSQGQVIALAQHEIAIDPDWYGYSLSKIQHEFYSHGGEHKLTFPKTNEIEITAIGGYLSACLGRTLSTFVSNFILSSDSKKLTLHLPMKAIFTGFIQQGNKLIPSTPYKESILDLSMDGLNFDQTLKLVSKDDLAKFIEETVKIAILEKSPMPRISPQRFILEVRIKNELIYQTGNKVSNKKIILSFE